MSGRLTRPRILPDWPAVEADYRAGHLSLREMAVRHRCSHSAIANKAKRDGWTRLGRARPITDAPDCTASVWLHAGYCCGMAADATPKQQT
jgi:hypothetical protein